MKSVLTLVETVEIAWEMKKPKFWTFSIGYLSLYLFLPYLEKKNKYSHEFPGPYSKSQIILDKKN